MDDHVDRLGHRERALGFRAGQVGDLTARDVDRDPGQEPDHHRVRHEPGVPAQPGQPGGHQHRPGHQRQQQQRLRALGLRHAPQRRARRQRRRRRGRDHHPPGARGQPPGDRSREARIQALHRVDADQHRGRHPVRDAADRTRQPGHQVRAQGPPLRPDRAQPPADRGHRPANHAHQSCSLPAAPHTTAAASRPSSLRAAATDAIDQPASRTRARSAPGEGRSAGPGRPANDAWPRLSQASPTGGEACLRGRS